jgi:hypothetical protein
MDIRRWFAGPVIKKLAPERLAATSWSTEGRGVVQPYVTAAKRVAIALVT